MKVHDYIEFHDDKLLFIGSQHVVPITDVKRVELAVRPVLKKAGATILNATANFMTSSLGNGNEHIRFQINITTSDGTEELLLNDKTYVRGNIDYYEFVERARRLKDVMRDSIKKHGGLKP